MPPSTMPNVLGCQTASPKHHAGLPSQHGAAGRGVARPCHAAGSHPGCRAPAVATADRGAAAAPDEDGQRQRPLCRHARGFRSELQAMLRSGRQAHLEAAKVAAGRAVRFVAQVERCYLDSVGITPGRAVG